MVTRLCSILLFNCLIAPLFAANRQTVSSLDDLRSKIAAAQPGDRIVVANGAYTADAPLAVGCAGTKDNPIVISAETVGHVEIKGAAGFRIQPGATYVTIEGFTFTHRSGKIEVDSGATQCRLLRNVFELTGDGPYLTVAGDDTEVAYNEFRNKSTVGNMISVIGPSQPTEDQMAQRLWVHHNYFHDFKVTGINGSETIRLGLSGRSMASAHALVEHNLFERCSGENELITNKSCANTYRYNTFRDSAGQFTLRHGNYCLVYGNYFLNTEGVRFFGDHQKIFSNYFEGNKPAILVGNGDGEVADGAKLTSHDRPDFCEVSYNTLVNNRENVVVAGRNHGMGSTHLTFANNLILGGNAALKLDAPTPDAVWHDTLIWKTGGPGALPEGSFREVDPKLAKDATGVFHLQPGSPAIGAGKGAVPSPAVDMDGQPRDDAPDLGADEASEKPVRAHILTPKEVGPASPEVPRAASGG